MSQKFIVGISDWKICERNDILVTYALGSCIGICLYDKITGISGLSHIMLPDSKSIAGGSATPMKFADTAIPAMLSAMRARGACAGITAKIAGGATMFQCNGAQFNIGERNIAAVRTVLAGLHIPIIAADTGLNYGRTVTFYSENGAVEVSSTVRGKNVI